MIEGEVVKVPAQFFTVSKSLKELTEGHGSNKKVTLPSVKRAIWNLLERKIEDICADIVTVEYLKSINEKRFIESYCFRALKKKYCDHYTQYTSEEIAGLLSLCHYLDIPFLISPGKFPEACFVKANNFSRLVV